MSFRECIWKRTGRDFLGVEFGDFSYFSMLELSSEEIGRFLYIFLLVLMTSYCYESNPGRPGAW